MDLGPEGRKLADILQYLDRKIRNARLFGSGESLDEMTDLRRTRAIEAIQYCKQHEVNYWDFLREVER